MSHFDENSYNALYDPDQEVSEATKRRRRREYKIKIATAKAIEKQLYELGLLSKEKGEHIQWVLDFVKKKIRPKVVLKNKK